MNDTYNNNFPAKNGLGYPQAILYIPSIVVATVLIVFLGISFIRYHRRVRNKMVYFRDYMEKNLHVKRERIPGHAISLNRTRIAYDTGSVFSREQTNDLQFTKGHSLPEIENNITVENEKSIYLKKPRTPKSYFDNDGYEEDISSNRCSRSRPIHELEMEEHFVKKESDNESETSISKSFEKIRVLDTECAHCSGGVEIPLQYLCETCQTHLKTRRVERRTSNDKEQCLDKVDEPRQSPPGEKDDDAFKRSPRPSMHEPPTLNEEEPKTRKKSVINSRTFPDARVRLGVFELEPR